MTTWIGLLGIIALLGIAYGLSNNRKAIRWRLVGVGFLLQWAIALFVLKSWIGQQLFAGITHSINALLMYADEGGKFVFGPLVSQPKRLIELFGPGGDFIFAFKLVPTIVFVATLVSMAYYLGIMQKVVKGMAWVVSKTMGASGSEALSNVASIFVGQIEAQLMIKPYVSTLTKSELLAVMAGSLACISGGIMAVYIQMGVDPAYLLTASLMAAPGALVIAKIIYPETETSATQGDVAIDIPKPGVNLIDAAAHGASDGFQIGLQVIAMLLGFIGLIALANGIIGWAGQWLSYWGLHDLLGLNMATLSLKDILGLFFSPIAFLLGVPWEEASRVGSLMGTKLVVNEFVAYLDMTHVSVPLSHKAQIIASFALCGFANFSSVAMQIGGIGEMAPERKADLARLGLKALLCGSMASYVSSAIAGILLSL